MKAAESPGAQTEDPPDQGWGESSAHHAASGRKRWPCGGRPPCRRRGPEASPPSARIDLLTCPRRPGGSVLRGVDGDQHAELRRRTFAGRSGSLAACLTWMAGANATTSHRVIDALIKSPWFPVTAAGRHFKRKTGQRRSSGVVVEIFLEPDPPRSQPRRPPRRPKGGSISTLASPCSAARGGSWTRSAASVVRGPGRRQRVVAGAVELSPICGWERVSMVTTSSDWHARAGGRSAGRRSSG